MNVSELSDKILEEISSGFVCLDGRWQILRHNRTGARAVGAPADENLSGKNLFDVLISNLGGLKIAFGKVSSDGKPRTFWGFPVSSSDGGKTYWDFTVSRLDEGILLSAVEVTDRVRAEHGLQDAIETARQSADKLQAVIGQMADGVIVCNADGSVSKINDATSEMLGDAKNLLYDGDGSLPHLINDTNGGDLRADEFPWRAAGLEGKTTIDTQLFVNRRADDRITVSVNAAPLYDNQRRLIGSVTVLRDVTENRRLIDELRSANRRLEEYNRLKAEFVANMSHELRTPLTAIIGFAQLIQMKYDKGEKVEALMGQGLEKILRNGRHLLTLIDEVLDLSKIEAGRLTLHLDYFDLPPLIETTFGSLESLAIEKKLNYKLTVSDDFPYVFSDSGRIKQIVLNLLSNAIKFTENGSILAELRRHDATEWQFVVRDTGAGIEAEHIEMIFERFRQVDGSYTRTADGFGLGLAISQHLAELLGGKITVESKYGEGSEFTLTLPTVAREAAALMKNQTDGDFSLESFKQDAGDTRQTILVIDDIADATELLSEMLTNAGYRVCVAHSGAEGLRMAREILPAAVTLDVMMPGMDGWRVLQEMKEDPRLVKIPVIVVSIVDNKPLGYRLGASDYLVKPVEPERLLQTLNGVVSESDGVSDYILVVDDEQGVRELLLNSLKQGGFNTMSAPSGEIALAMAEKNPPKAVLTDLHMPGGMSGYELVARLRSRSETTHTPIIIITGKDLMKEDRTLISGQIAEVIRKGDLLLSDLDVRLRETLAEIGVEPTNEENNAG